MSTVAQDTTSDPHDPDTGIMHTAEVAAAARALVFPEKVPDLAGFPEFDKVNVPPAFSICVVPEPLKVDSVTFAVVPAK